MNVRMSDRPSLRRFERRAVAAGFVVVVAALVLMASGCLGRWPIVITGGGSGTGEGSTVRK